MISEPLYTVNEAAALPWLRLSAWTLWDHLKQGKLVRTKIAGKTFIRESELQKLIVETVTAPKAGKPRARRTVRPEPAAAR